MSRWYIDKGPDSDVVISSRVRLARNFEAYPFPHKSSREEQLKVIQETIDALVKDDAEFQECFRFIPITRLMRQTAGAGGEASDQQGIGRKQDRIRINPQQ
jgi:protein arginine kinase